MCIPSFVFPMFLFTMGMSIPYALERRYAKGYSGESTLGHMTVYMMPYLLYSLTGFFGLYTYDCLTGIPGLLKCALFSLVCVGLTGLLSKAGIKLKV